MEPPNRHGGGGQIRQSYLLEGLAQRAEVDLYAAEGVIDDVVLHCTRRVIQLPPIRSSPGPDHRALRLLHDLRLVTRTGPPEVWLTRPAQEQLRSALPSNGPYDVIHVEHEGLSVVAASRKGAPRWTLTLHNIGSTRLTQQAAAASGRRQAWMARGEAARNRALEAQALRRFDVVFTVSDKDAAELSGRSVVSPNGVDVSHYVPTPLGHRPHAVLTGTLDYLPNVEGVEWLLKEVWPIVRARVPDATLSIVGRSPTPALVARDGSEGVRVFADVPSTVSYIHEARVALVPLRIGSGTRLKALEAMGSGRPVVGTSIGLEGLAIRDGVHALMRDDPQDFADAVITVFNDDNLALDLVRAGRHYVERHHDWRALAPRFADQVFGGSQ